MKVKANAVSKITIPRDSGFIVNNIADAMVNTNEVNIYMVNIYSYKFIR